MSGGYCQGVIGLLPKMMSNDLNRIWSHESNDSSDSIWID